MTTCGSTPSTGPEHPLIHVAAGAISDATGRILITRRATGRHQGGLWEFPGGKLEPGETPAQGLARELAEELGIAVRACRPLIQVRHDYGDRAVLLDVWRVTAFDGTPGGREGQPLTWVHPEKMHPRAFPAADRPVIAALRLPARYLITGANPADPVGFLDRLQRALAGGPRLVQLRAHDLDAAAYARLATAAAGCCAAAGVRLVLNRDPAEVAPLLAAGASGRSAVGLHLSARQLRAATSRPGPPGVLVGASCHDAVELNRAAALGLDYALLSPVVPTASHPGAPVLGWSGFAALAAGARLPVYALGGVGPADLPTAWRHGAQGVAGIRAFWPVCASA